MASGDAWGPLGALAGTWEGAEGLDEGFNNASGKVIETPFRERTTFSPFGPVENGRQVLYGLDYRTAAWRADEENPFHTEVGYWLWDAADGQVLRCFMIPRGQVVMAGGDAGPDDTELHMAAELGSQSYGILSNRDLASFARTTRYEVTVVVGDGVFSYEETTVIEHGRLPGILLHTDRNTLRRVEG
ncbi:MAG TPA: heme-binding beta-barrel domain-containing protein [Acidimicrobiales bacterium]